MSPEGRTVVTIYTQHISAEHGLWCDSCALPSVVREDFIFFGKHRLVPVSHARCRECGNRPDDDVAGR